MMRRYSMASDLTGKLLLHEFSLVRGTRPILPVGNKELGHRALAGHGVLLSACAFAARAYMYVLHKVCELGSPGLAELCISAAREAVVSHLTSMCAAERERESITACARARGAAGAQQGGGRRGGCWGARGRRAAPAERGDEMSQRHMGGHVSAYRLTIYRFPGSGLPPPSSGGALPHRSAISSRLAANRDAHSAATCRRDTARPLRRRPPRPPCRPAWRSPGGSCSSAGSGWRPPTTRPAWTSSTPPPRKSSGPSPPAGPATPSWPWRPPPGL